MGSPVPIIVIFSLILLLSGCVAGRYYEGPQISPGKIRESKPGITTKQDIIGWFGPPQNYISPTIFNEILRELDVTREPLTNYPFANILSYQYNRGNIHAIVILFDKEGVVKNYGYQKGTPELTTF